MRTISPALCLEFREFCVNLVLRQIDDVFQMAGFQPGTISTTRNISGQRRIRVEEYYASIDWADEEDTQKFLHVLGLVLSQTYISEEQKNLIREMCLTENLIVDGYQIRLPEVDIKNANDLFANQFPAGLPFGKSKPDFGIIAKDGGQSLKFELKSGIGIIWRDVYPNFDFQTFQMLSEITESTNLALKHALIAMNQTEREKEFFQAYAKYFKMANNHIPMLIPQAWIQWHSLPKSILRSSHRTLADELYRVDFVMFWENQRFAVLIDDISHYAVKRGELWLADEKSYSMRLEEDRKLQAEGWKIFRVSNWEIKQKRVKGILLDLKKFIGF